MADVGIVELRAQQLAFFEVAIAQVRARKVGVGQVSLAKSAAREVASGETDAGHAGDVEVASPHRGFGRHHLASIRMTEVGVIETRAQQIAAVHLDREQLASIEVAERQIASEEAGLAQLAKREGRARRSGLVGEDAILERRAAKIRVGKAASDEAASQELRAVASSVFPIDLGKDPRPR